MSTKSTIILTSHNEHWFEDCSEPLETKDGSRKDAITLEFDKGNIRIDCNDKYDLIITIINPDCEIYDIISKLRK